jgi:hypothetical protein
MGPDSQFRTHFFHDKSRRTLCTRGRSFRGSCLSTEGETIGPKSNRPSPCSLARLAMTLRGCGGVPATPRPRSANPCCCGYNSRGCCGQFLLQPRDARVPRLDLKRAAWVADRGRLLFLPLHAARGAGGDDAADVWHSSIASGPGPVVSSPVAAAHCGLLSYGLHQIDGDPRLKAEGRGRRSDLR